MTILSPRSCSAKSPIARKSKRHATIELCTEIDGAVATSSDHQHQISISPSNQLVGLSFFATSFPTATKRAHKSSAVRHPRANSQRIKTMKRSEHTLLTPYGANSMLLSRREAAASLGVAEQALAVWKCFGCRSRPLNPRTSSRL